MRWRWMTREEREHVDAFASGAGKDAGSVFDLDGWLLAGAIVFVVASLIIPLAGLIIEVLLVLGAPAGASAGTLLFRRPWSIEIRRAGTEPARERVVGWDASRRRMAEIAAIVAAGDGEELVAQLRAGGTAHKDLAPDVRSGPPVDAVDRRE